MEKTSIWTKLFGEDYANKDSSYSRCLFVIGSIIAIAIALISIWINGLSARLGIFYNQVQQRSLFLGISLVLIFLEKRLWKGAKRVNVLDVAMMGLAIFTCSYAFRNSVQFQFRLGNESQLDIIVGFIITVLVIEGCRRMIGPVMPSIAAIFMAYALFGNYLPRVIGHKGFTLSRIFGHLTMNTEGIYGMPLGTAATYVALFVVYASFLQVTGGGEAFMDMAFSLFGRVRGGPAKVSVIGSGLFGSINGSAVANVVGTGSFTIPLMKKMGYEGEDAGAIEAVASTGGQIMPPIMGSAAFIMAETLSMSYIKIAAAALIPAVLYYFSVFFQVDLSASERHLSGMKKEDLPRFSDVMKKYWHILLSPVLLVVLMLVVGYSALMAAVYALIVLLITSSLRKSTRLSLQKFISALTSAGRGVLEVASATACAGIIVGVFSLTGLGGKLSNALMYLSGGHLLPLLILCMVCSVILGMGMPTTGAYIILSILVAPALSKMHMPLLPGHMFVFYFGAISAITPPVALASYAGASIAKADIMKTGIQATKYGIAAFLVPYYFIYRNGLLLMGGPLDILYATVVSIFGLIAFGIGVRGFCSVKLSKWMRAIVILIAISLSFPETISDIAGSVLLVAILVYLRFQKKKMDQVPSAE